MRKNSRSFSIAVAQRESERSYGRREQKRRAAFSRLHGADIIKGPSLSVHRVQKCQSREERCKTRYGGGL